MALEAVIFDWGGTLTTHRVTVPEVMARWRLAAEVIAPTHADALAEMLFRADQQRWDQARVDRRSFRVDAVVGTALAELADTGVPTDERSGDVRRGVEAYLDGWGGSIVHDPDAAAVLRGLRERGLATGLLSNTFWPASFHDGLLARDSLAELFTGRCYSCDLDNLKPHPNAFQAAIASVGVSDPSAVLFVGDRADDDIAGAQAVGLRTAWRPNPNDPFAPPPPQRAPDAVISALPELLDLVDRL